MKSRCLFVAGLVFLCGGVVMVAIGTTYADYGLAHYYKSSDLESTRNKTEHDCSEFMQLNGCEFKENITCISALEFYFITIYENVVDSTWATTSFCDMMQTCDGRVKCMKEMRTNFDTYAKQSSHYSSNGDGQTKYDHGIFLIIFGAVIILVWLVVTCYKDCKEYCKEFCK